MPNTMPARVTAQRAEVVDAVLRAIDHDGLHWVEPFIHTASPHNPVTGNRYRGTNRTNLAAIAVVRGYDDPRWLTWSQIQRAGLRVRKGARSAVIEKWKLMPVGTATSDETDEPRMIPRCVGYFNVFNGSEIDGLAPLDQPAPLPRSVMTDVADRLIASSRCEVRTDRTGGAYYSPRLDLVHMPPREMFVGDTDDERAEGYVATLLHELTHATAPAVGRKAEGRFGSPDYAREELVAELGAMFAEADLGIRARQSDNDPHFVQHAAYLQSWSRMLHDRPGALYAAAGFAERAAAYLVERYTATGAVTAA